MKIFWYLIFLVFFQSCDLSNKRLVYHNSSNNFYVKIEESKGKLYSDSLWMFYDYNSPKVLKEAGFFKDGFRNGVWTYNSSGNIKTIKWGYFKDKKLKFETNLFESADSIKYGDSFTKFLFKAETGNIILNIAINSSLKDIFNQDTYRRYVETDFASINMSILDFKTTTLDNNPNIIYINQIKVKSKTLDEKRFVKEAISYIDKHYFINFSVGYSLENDFYANVLFDAVLTNFKVDGIRLYNPIRTQ